MYPLKDGEPYPRNHWYVAGASTELGRELRSRRILDIPVVLYRTEAGDPVALHDLCPHRRFPLSKSKLIGDRIQCGYHGFTFDASGRCVALPTGDRVPASYRVRRFPIVERWQWVWIWMGDPGLADPGMIPDQELIRTESAGWEPAIIGMTTVKARHLLLHENLLDLSHLTYLHDGTVGSAGIAKTRMEIEDRETYLEITRRIQGDDMNGVPLARALGIDGPVDRLMVQQFFAPALHATGSAFTRAEDGKPAHYFGAFRVLHAITPETPTSTHYFYAFSRDFSLGDTNVGERVAASIARAVEEDVYASEEIEKSISVLADPSEDIHSRADAGALRGRLAIERLIAGEARQSSNEMPNKSVERAFSS